MQLRHRAVSLSHTMEDRGTAQSHKPPSKVKRAAERAEKRAEKKEAKIAEKTAKEERKKQEQAARLEVAAARKAERSRRSELHKAGMTQDEEVKSKPPSINNALCESLNVRCNVCISLKIFNFASHFFRVQIFQIAL